MGIFEKFFRIMVPICKGLLGMKRTEKKSGGQSYVTGAITLATQLSQLLIGIFKFRLMLVVFWFILITNIWVPKVNH